MSNKKEEKDMPKCPPLAKTCKCHNTPSCPNNPPKKDT